MKLKKPEREDMNRAIVDVVRLRAALVMACTHLTDDPIKAIKLAEYFDDQAREQMWMLTAADVKKLPATPAKVVPVAISLKM